MGESRPSPRGDGVFCIVRSRGCSSGLLPGDLLSVLLMEDVGDDCGGEKADKPLSWVKEEGGEPTGLESDPAGDNSPFWKNLGNCPEMSSLTGVSSLL